ncbi:hypothetical protein BAE44_0021496, partial [Dichanthelium oligosanthes]
LVRNDKGVVIVSGWRLLFYCSSADEAELLAYIKVLKEGYVKLEVNRINRDQNVIAHELAKHARVVNSSAVWIAGVSSFLEHLVQNDCNPG